MYRGDVSDIEEEADGASRTRSSRLRKPPQKFGYDHLGMPNVNQIWTQPAFPSYSRNQYQFVPASAPFQHGQPQLATSLSSQFSPSQLQPTVLLSSYFQPPRQTYSQPMQLYSQMYQPHQPYPHDYW